MRALRQAAGAGLQLAAGIDAADDAGTDRPAARPGRHRDPGAQLERHLRRAVERPALRLQRELVQVERGGHGEAAVGEAGPALVDRQGAEAQAPGSGAAGADAAAPMPARRGDRERGDRDAEAGAAVADAAPRPARPRLARSRHSIALRCRGRGAAAAPAAPACRWPRFGPTVSTCASSSSICSAASSGVFGVAEQQLGDRDPPGIDAQLRRAVAGLPVQREVGAQGAGERRPQHALQVGPRHDQRQVVEPDLHGRAGGVALAGERELALVLGRADDALALEDHRRLERPGDRLGVEAEGLDGELGRRRGGRVAPVELAGADRQGGEARLPARGPASPRPRRSPPTPACRSRRRGCAAPHSPRWSAAARAPPAPRRRTASRRRAAGSPCPRRCARRAHAARRYRSAPAWRSARAAAGRRSAP